MRICISFEEKDTAGKACVEQLGAVLKDMGNYVCFFNMRELDPQFMPQVDVYVFSSPTQMGNAPFSVRGFLKNAQLPKNGAKYALMTTTQNPKTKTLKTMDEKIAPKGLEKAADDLIIMTKSTKGPLEDGYDRKLEDFAVRILNSK